MTKAMPNTVITEEVPRKSPCCFHSIGDCPILLKPAVPFILFSRAMNFVFRRTAVRQFTFKTLCTKNQSSMNEFSWSACMFSSLCVPLFQILMSPLKANHALSAKQRKSNTQNPLHSKAQNHWKYRILASVSHATSWLILNGLSFSYLVPWWQLVIDKLVSLKSILKDLCGNWDSVTSTVHTLTCVKNVTGLACFLSQTLPVSLNFSTILNNVALFETY